MSIPRLLILAVIAFTAGCAGPDGTPWPALAWPWPATSSKGLSVHEGGGGASHASEPRGEGAVFSFDWQLDGDPRIMPVQVFDDGFRMWLQFAPEGAWPAIFKVAEHGWQPLPYRNEGPYMVLSGVHDRLELRGGHLRGSVRRAQAAALQAPPAAAPGTPAESLRHEVRQTPTEPQPPGTREAPGTAVPLPDGLAGTATPGVATVIATPGVETIPIDTSRPAAEAYTVSPADVTMRQALERWATTAGWTFSAEHWAVDVDIPLVGQASFQADFRTAVRELLAATEMGDRALQPCFYSNRVLRVVPYAQACDRRRGMGAMS